MKDVKSMALKHLIEKLVAMPSKAEASADPLEEAAAHEGPSPFTGEHMDADDSLEPKVHVAEIEVLKKPKGK